MKEKRSIKMLKQKNRNKFKKIDTTDNYEMMVLRNKSFQDIRALIDENGDPLFCGVDVANDLGYADPDDAISVHCPSAKKIWTWVQTGINSNNNPIMKMAEVSFITESEVCILIVCSNMPQAIMFENWMMEEVLPSIRTQNEIMTQLTFRQTLMDPKVLSALIAALRNDELYGSATLELQ
ncbi:MAG: Bro-N domain-containing protein [Bacteroidales bacterium]|nr:Bro-N domain-containing protein [Bacteroidales bacterium]